MNALRPSLRNDWFVNFVAGILVSALMLVGGPTAWAAAAGQSTLSSAGVTSPIVTATCYAIHTQAPPVPSAEQVQAMQTAIAAGWGITGNSPGLTMSQDELGAAIITPTMQPNDVVWHQIAVIDSADLPGWTLAASGLMTTSAAEIQVSYSVVLFVLSDNQSTDLVAAIRTNWIITNPAGSQQATLLTPIELDTPWTAAEWASTFESPYRSHRMELPADAAQCLRDCNDTYTFCMSSATNDYGAEKVMCYAAAAAAAGATALCGVFFLICLIPVGGGLDLCLIDAARKYDLASAACIQARNDCIRDKCLSQGGIVVP